jgi:transcriptional regulator with XRE-family HTH domain
MAENLGNRLRQERERRRVPLASIASDTKIGLSLLEGLERDDVSQWPSGIFRRSFLRAYVQAIGLDPDPVLREFLERYPDPGEVVSAASVVSARARAAVPSARGRSPARLGALLTATVRYRQALNRRIVDRLRLAMAAVRRAARTSAGGLRVLHAASKLLVGSGLRRAQSFHRASQGAVSRTLQSLTPPVVIKVSIASDQSPFVRGNVLRDLRSRWAAVACDAAMLVLVALTMFLVLDSIWTSFAIATACYYLVGILVLGNTPGICLCAPPLDRARRGVSPAQPMPPASSAASHAAST